MRYINELKEGDLVTETYFCKTKNTLRTKAGKPYYSLLLQDKTGTIDAKVWDPANGIGEFEALSFIRVDGQVVSFQGTPQMSIRRIRRSEAGEYREEDYMPMSKRDIEEMYGELLGLLDSIREPHLQRLTESFFLEDEELVERFKRHSAAKSVHHGFIGGLLEHTLNVARMCDYMAGAYPILNRDLLIAGALLHDIGKTAELSAFPENDYTDEGQLLGHIYLGAEMVARKVAKIPDFPPLLATELKHCILAHHGELEYGSPKKPALAEAMALNFADNADAKLQTLTEALEGAQGRGDWLGYNKLFESNIRRT